MKINLKNILLMSIFIFMLIGICGVNAQEVSNDTTSSDLSDNTQISTDSVDDNTLNSNVNNNVEKVTTKQKNIKTDEDSIDITNENYDQLSTYMNQYSTLNFADDFDGKTIEITNGVTVTSTSDYTFTNSHFIVNANGVTINNLNNKAKSNIKSDSKTMILNTSNFAEYVTNGQFNDNVTEGDVIDIHGELIGSQYAITFNKAVNVTSTTNDALLNFEDQSFIISTAASGSNITGLTLRDTTINVEASYIFLNNNTISVSDEGYAIVLAEGITNVTISNNAIASLNGRANDAINDNSVSYSSQNNTNTPLYVVITDSNWNLYVPDGMFLGRYFMDGDYLSFDGTYVIFYVCYDDLTLPSITIYNTTSCGPILLLGTNSITIENSIINVAPYASTNETVVKLVNSTIIQIPSELLDGMDNPFTLDMDENSLFLNQSDCDSIYGGWLVMGPMAGGKTFEKTVTTVYVLFYLDQYLPDVVEEIKSTNGEPIITKTTNITGILGKIWLETIFEEGADGSIVTNIFFNESVNITSPLDNVKFINCTFNKGIFIINGSNITMEGCTGNVTYYDEIIIPPKTIVLTADNYNEYVTDGTFNSNVNKGDTIDMQGLFDSSLKGLTVNKAVNIISSTNDANISLDSGLDTRRTGNQFIISSKASGTNITGISFYNTRVTVDGAKKVSINNITFTNYMEQIGSNVGGFSIRNDASNVNVTNSKFLTHGNFGHSTLVVAGANNVLLENNTVIGETDDVNVLGKIGNLVYITTYGTDGENYNITVRGNYIDGSKILRDNEIANTFRIQGENITVENNTILATDYAILEQWVQGVDVLVKNLIIKDNNLTGAVNLASQNVIMTNNRLDSVSVTNSTLTGNTIESLNLGHDSVLIGGNISNSIKLDENITIENNIINAKLDLNTSNIVCNNVTFNDKVSLNDSTSNITFIGCKFNKGLYVSGKDIEIENCTGKIIYLDTILKVDTTDFVVGENATISASIYFDDKIASTINLGKVIFKVDGKSLKDSSGKVIYAKVVNGTARIEGYEVPVTWKENSTIQAVYSGSTESSKLNSEKENITITKQQPTITTEDITTTEGSTITLKANINTNGAINTGKVVFKINGKTVKDSNGKVIYAKVINNAVSIDYVLPDSYKADEYNITAVFTSAYYDKLEDTKTLTVTA